MQLTCYASIDCFFFVLEEELCVYVRTYSCEQLRILPGGSHVGYLSLLLALWCHYTLMRRAAALVRFHTLGGLFAGRRANGTAEAWDVDCGWCLVMIECGAGCLRSRNMPVLAVVQAVYPDMTVCFAGTVTDVSGGLSLQGWMLGNTQETPG